MPVFGLKRAPGLNGRRQGVTYLAVAAVAGVLISLQLWHDLARLRRQEEQLRIVNASLDVLHRKVSTERRAAQQERQKQVANGGNRALTAADVLAGLEGDWQDNISVLRLDGDIGKRRMRLQVLAKSREALFQFAERLTSRFGDNVFIERHALTPASGDGWVVNASMAVGWK